MKEHTKHFYTFTQEVSIFFLLFYDTLCVAFFSIGMY